MWLGDHALKKDRIPVLITPSVIEKCEDYNRPSAICYVTVSGIMGRVVSGNGKDIRDRTDAA